MGAIFLSLTLMILSFYVEAKEAARHSSQSLSNIMLEVRDPIFSSLERKKYLQFVQSQMQLKLASELKVSKDKLTQAFMQRPDHMDRLWESPWIDLQTEFYTTLHQEMLSDKWNSFASKKRVTDYGQTLTKSMLFHLGKFSSVKEGRFYNRWDLISVTAHGKRKDYRIPHFVFTKDINSLIKIDAHAPYEALFPKASEETSINPSLSTFIKQLPGKSREDLQELAEKVQLNHRIYVRAVANAAKTVASVHYLTGEFSFAETEKKVGAFVSSYCQGCSVKEKQDYQQTAMAYVLKTKKEFTREYLNAKEVVRSFCSDLSHNGYIFPALSVSKPQNDFSRFTPPPMAIDNTRVDRSHITASIEIAKFNAVRKAVAEHDLGVLFLTNALSRLNNKHDAVGTQLGCYPQTLEQDARLVKLAIAEAQKNVEQYLSQINARIKVTANNIHKAQDTLEYFTQTNVSATAEALMTFPQGLNHVVDSVWQLDRDVKRRKRVDMAVAWGGTIVGIALTVSGIGAPEGVALLLTVGAMTKGAISGTYHLVRSQQEKAFHKELQNAKVGLGHQFYLNQNLSAHYETYRDLRMAYLVDFAGSVISFAKIHQAALTKSSGDIPKAHGLIRKTMERMKAIAEDMGQDELNGFLMEMAQL